MSDPRFAGKPLPQPRFPGDVGDVNAEVAATFSAFATGAASLREVQGSLVGTRLLVPTVASLEESAADPVAGQSSDARSHLASVTLRSEAGWTGLLAFTSMESVRAWDPAARPVPVAAQEAAQAALTDGNTVLVLDLAGPVRVALTGTYLRALSQGRRALPPAADPDVQVAVQRVAGGVPGLRSVEVIASPTADADAVVVLTLAAGVQAPDIAEQLARALAEDPVLRDRLDRGLALAVVSESDESGDSGH